VAVHLSKGWSTLFSVELACGSGITTPKEHIKKLVMANDLDINKM
jgi:hypothetical protein